MFGESLEMIRLISPWVKFPGPKLRDELRNHNSFRVLFSNILDVLLFVFCSLCFRRLWDLFSGVAFLSSYIVLKADVTTQRGRVYARIDGTFTLTLNVNK